MSVKTIPYGTANKKFFHITFTSNEHIDNVHCVLDAEGKYSFATYNKDFYPSVCGSYENFKKVMECVWTGKLTETHKSSQTANTITIHHDKDGTKFPPFTLKLQPYIQRTDAIILAEVKAYMESIDGELAKLFVSHVNHVSFFGFDLMEKGAKTFTVGNAIKKIEEICSATHAELVANKSPIVAFIDRLNMIDALHKKFVAKVEKDCEAFGEKFAESAKAEIAKNDELHNTCKFKLFVEGWILSFFDYEDNCLTSYSTYVFKCGEIVEVNVEKGCDVDLPDEVTYAITTVSTKIANKIMADEAYGYPKYVIDMGKYQEMICGKVEVFDVYGNDGYCGVLAKIARFDASLTPESIKNAFPHPAGKGILIDTCEELDAVQQHIISILDEAMDERSNPSSVGKRSK